MVHSSDSFRTFLPYDYDVYATVLYLKNEYFDISSFFFRFTGESCKITYGSGTISGFFSQDHVLVGDLLIKDQVSPFLSNLCCSLRAAVIVSFHTPGFYWDDARSESHFSGGEVWWHSWTGLPRNFSWERSASLVQIYVKYFTPWYIMRKHYCHIYIYLQQSLNCSK